MGKNATKTGKHFKWLRRIWNRLRHKHSKFKDGKYTKGSKDVEKWKDDTTLTRADYPDYRWQTVTKSKAKRMVPATSHANRGTVDKAEIGHSHTHDPNQRCACQTLKDLGMLHHEPLPTHTKSGSGKKSRQSRNRTKNVPHETMEQDSRNVAKEKQHFSEKCSENCACHKLQELGMLWYDSKVGTAAAPNETNRKVVTAELHKMRDFSLEDKVEEVINETLKEVKNSKETVQQWLQTTPVYHPLQDPDELLDEGAADQASKTGDFVHEWPSIEQDIDTTLRASGLQDIPDDYPYLQKAHATRTQTAKKHSLGPRYVPFPSTSSNWEDNIVELNLTEIVVEPSQEYPSVVQGSAEHRAAESDNDKNHLKTIEDAQNGKGTKYKAKSSPGSKRPKTLKRKRTLRQKADRKLRKYVVPKGYKKLKEEDVDDDIIKMEQDLDLRKERRKYLRKHNVPEWMMGEETLVLRMRQMNVDPSLQEHNQARHPTTPTGVGSRNAVSRMPRGSPRAQKGSPRYILYQMQQQQKLQEKLQAKR